jgi:hypothetical protein
VSSGCAGRALNIRAKVVLHVGRVGPSSSSAYGPVQGGRPPGCSSSDGLLDNRASSRADAVSSCIELVDLDFNIPYVWLARK